MRYLSPFRLLFPLFVLLFPVFFHQCKPQETDNPNLNLCDVPISAELIDDSEINGFDKGRILQLSHRAIGVNSAEFNRNGNVVVIPMGFPSAPHNTALHSNYFKNFFFADQANSLNGFIKEISYGKYSLTNAGTSTRVLMSRDIPGYTLYNGDTIEWAVNPDVMREACQGSTNIDWAALDVNNDRVLTIDEVAIICTVPIRVTGGPFWGIVRYIDTKFDYQGTEYSLRARVTFMDAKRQDDYNKAFAPIPLPVLAHEMCHQFFNLYDRYSAGGVDLMGYDLMTNWIGDWEHLSAYDKMKIGWLKPKILLPVGKRANKEKICVTLKASQVNASALVLYNPDLPDECWVVEFRNKSTSLKGFDNRFPDSMGLCIWWADLKTDIIRLVDAQKPDGFPSDFNNPGVNASFMPAALNPDYNVVLFGSNKLPHFILSKLKVSEDGSTFSFEI